MKTAEIRKTPIFVTENKKEFAERLANSYKDSSVYGGQVRVFYNNIHMVDSNIWAIENVIPLNPAIAISKRIVLIKIKKVIKRNIYEHYRLYPSDGITNYDCPDALIRCYHGAYNNVEKEWIEEVKKNNIRKKKIRNVKVGQTVKMDSGWFSATAKVLSVRPLIVKDEYGGEYGINRKLISEVL